MVKKTQDLGGVVEESKQDLWKFNEKLSDNCFENKINC